VLAAAAGGGGDLLESRGLAYCFPEGDARLVTPPGEKCRIVPLSEVDGDARLLQGEFANMISQLSDRQPCLAGGGPKTRARHVRRGSPVELTFPNARCAWSLGHFATFRGSSRLRSARGGEGGERGVKVDPTLRLEFNEPDELGE